MFYLIFQHFAAVHVEVLIPIPKKGEDTLRKQQVTGGKLREIQEEAKSFAVGNKVLAALLVHTPTGDEAFRGTTGLLELLSTAIMDGWMARLGAALPPNTNGLGQLLSEYVKRVRVIESSVLSIDVGIYLYQQLRVAKSVGIVAHNKEGYMDIYLRNSSSISLQSSVRFPSFFLIQLSSLLNWRTIGLWSDAEMGRFVRTACSKVWNHCAFANAHPTSPTCISPAPLYLTMCNGGPYLPLLLGCIHSNTLSNSLSL
ncbi:putative ATP binding protein [Corchorus olitorius]|uniref:ATP binding protein n=1 Tax=Corchorus olitorius TaxID=93759 RepID=A0A1R3IMV2_9ROSI|nr:putative ATP binding protein [Corchorus olitorius]